MQVKPLTKAEVLKMVKKETLKEQFSLLWIDRNPRMMVSKMQTTVKILTGAECSTNTANALLHVIDA